MNKKMWSLYKDSENGKKVIELFNPEVEDIYQGIEKLFDYAKKWGSMIEPEHAAIWYFQMLLNLQDSNFLQGDEITRELYADFIENFEIIEAKLNEDESVEFYTDAKAKWVKQDNFRQKAALMHLVSTFLYYNFEFFKPIIPQTRFDIIQRNCDALGIELPAIPHTKDYKAYLMYYYDVCTSMNAFQKEQELSDAEFCACLYDFAPMLIDEGEKVDLPKPVNVWLTGSAGKGDFEYLDKLGKGLNYNAENIWACNERTRRGDIIVVYCNAPRSYIHSIWRANSAGIFNPFDYYHCRTTVCDGVRVPEISFKDLKADGYFSQVPIVRRNLQGINGIELTAQDYSELLRFIAEKGGDVSALPKLFEGGDIDFGEIKLEKDVEENILIPMLQRLGYSETDWSRQLSQKAGRTEKAIPDFVFFPRGEKHFENAPMVIEAKLDMSLITEQQKAFSQGLSYARMLRSSLMGICDTERIIIYRVDKDGSADRNNPLYENHWKAIYSDEVEGAKLKQLIGREVVAKL